MENIGELLQSMTREVFRRLEQAEAGSGRKTWPATKPAPDGKPLKEQRDQTVAEKEERV